MEKTQAPVPVSCGVGILAVCWMSGRVSEFDKWYLIIAGTVGLYCWVSELVELLRERKKEKERQRQNQSTKVFVAGDLGPVDELGRPLRRARFRGFVFAHKRFSN